VLSSASYLEQPREYRPFYSLRHHYGDDTSDAFWYSTRRASTRKGDQGTEVYLSVVDLNFQPANPPVETLAVQITCTNRDLPPRLPLGDAFGDVFLEAASSIRTRLIKKPTAALRPALRAGLQWRLISHLSLNYLSLMDGGPDALREILKLYDFTDSPAIRNQIAGITGISSQPHMARMTAAAGVVFSLGMRVNIEFDEALYAGGGVFVLASVLERFLGLYTSVNSFTQLAVTSRQRKEVIRQWLPRAGEQILL
jgi:type VI secretion system protein ImpG